MNESIKNETNNLTWRQRINYNTVTASIFIVFWTVMFFMIPYQIQKPKLFLGRSLMGLQPTLFPQLATLGLIGLNIWYLIISFRLQEKNLFKELKKENLFKVIASLMVFIAYVNMLIWPIRQMGRILTDMGKAVVALGRIQEILDQPLETSEEHLVQPAIQGNLEFRNVSFEYEPGKPIAAPL